MPIDRQSEMLAEVEVWCIDRAEKIMACVVEDRGTDVLFFFVPNGKQFNFDLADELADLNRNLMTTWGKRRVDVGQVPATEIDRFIDLAKAQLVFGSLPERKERTEA